MYRVGSLAVRTTYRTFACSLNNNYNISCFSHTLERLFMLRLRSTLNNNLPSALSVSI